MKKESILLISWSSVIALCDWYSLSYSTRASYSIYSLPRNRSSYSKKCADTHCSAPVSKKSFTYRRDALLDSQALQEFEADVNVTIARDRYRLSEAFLREAHLLRLRQWAESDHLLRSGAIVDALVECIPLLPNLKTLTSDPTHIMTPLPGLNGPRVVPDTRPTLIQWYPDMSQQELDHTAAMELQEIDILRGRLRYHPSIIPLEVLAALPPHHTLASVDLRLFAATLLQPSLAYVFTHKGPTLFAM